MGGGGNNWEGVSFSTCYFNYVSITLTIIPNPKVTLTLAALPQSASQQQFVPQLAALPTTNGAFATGDGIRLGVAVGAVPVDMDKVRLGVPTIPPTSISPFPLRCYLGVGIILN